MSLMKRIVDRLEDEQRRKRNRIDQTDVENQELRRIRKYLKERSNVGSQEM